MGITRYKNIAAAQNPGSQRTGKATGGRVRSNEVVNHNFVPMNLDDEGRQLIMVMLHQKQRQSS